MSLTQTSPDKRYRISVYLVQEGRPKYWSFHCVNCGQKICELDGQIMYISDVDDANRYETSQVGRPYITRCHGKYCHYWYEFTLNG